MKYNKALDLILASALAFKAGKHAEAAKHLSLAAEEDDFDEAVDMMDATNEEASDAEAIDELDGGDDAATAAFKAIGSKVSKRRALAGDDVSTEDLGDGDLPSDAQSTDSPERRGEEAVAARLERASKNRRVLAKRK